jgi:hypothetical protein
MGLSDKLRHAVEHLRKLRLSLGPDSYFQYKRGRKAERKRADQVRQDVTDSAEREGEEAVRGREYEERYAREGEGDLARERTEGAEEMEPDR